MTKYLLINEMNCTDPTKEKEFNDWLNTVHLPDIMETKEYRRVTRYELVQGAEGKGKYITVSEIETDDFPALTAAHNNRLAKKKDLGHDTNLIKGVPGGRGLYKQIFEIRQK
jgi:hypothetical protein